MFDDFDEFEDIDIDEELDGAFLPDEPLIDIDIKVRTAILRKNNMLALLCYKSAAEGAAICRVDPRENRPAVQLYDDPNAALEWFTKSLRTSSRNGWQVIYDGLPLQG
jgi:hypothetical protein